jgi:putative DNA primase/helicase
VKGAARRRYEVRDASGVLVAIHVRIDRPGSGKIFGWELPDGRRTLGGLAVRDLPLYGIDRLDGNAARVVLVEGEKAAEALWSVGIAAVGTVTGAKSAPGPKPLAELSGRNLFLWPDADAVGMNHMTSLANQLDGIAASVRIVHPSDGVPSGWDAADAIAAGRDLLPLLEAAERWEAPRNAAWVGGPALVVTTAMSPVITVLSTVEPQPLEWLWVGYVPLGMLTILDGDPGLGKSLLTRIHRSLMADGLHE